MYTNFKKTNSTLMSELYVVVTYKFFVPRCVKMYILVVGSSVSENFASSFLTTGKWLFYADGGGSMTFQNNVTHLSNCTISLSRGQQFLQLPIVRVNCTSTCGGNITFPGSIFCHINHKATMFRNISITNIKMSNKLRYGYHKGQDTTENASIMYCTKHIRIKTLWVK